jgi:membrane protease YdiL (CAAX protease family)
LSLDDPAPPPDAAPPETPRPVDDAWRGWSATRLVVLALSLMTANLAAQVLAFQLTGNLFAAAGAGAALTILFAAGAAQAHAAQTGGDAPRTTRTHAAFDLVRMPAGECVLCAAAALGSLLPTSLLAGLSSGLHPPGPEWIAMYNRHLPGSAAGIALAAAAVVVAAPLAEELVFRGLIYRLGRRAWGPWPAAVVSALVFGLVHGEPWYLFGLVALGLLLAAVYELTGSLWSAVIVHAVHNAVALALLVVQGGLAADEPPATLGDWSGAALSFAAVLGVVVLLRRRAAVRER